MLHETKGIIFRQVKTVNGRRMILLFTEKFGKISVGANAYEGRKNKSNLAMRPFTYAVYDIYSNREYYNMKKGQAVKSFYAIGEDVDKYMAASYGLELCEKLLPENQPAPDVFNTTVDFLSAMEERKNRFETILLAYKLNLIKYMGVLPDIYSCGLCGKKDDLKVMDIQEGIMLCSDCEDKRSSLSLEVDFKALSVLYYIVSNPIGRLVKLGLEKDIEEKLEKLADSFIEFHLDPGKIKSEEYMSEFRR